MSEVRHPRSIVTINGEKKGCLSWDVNNNGYYQADTFAARFVLNNADVDWWSRQTSLDVMIYDGFPADPQDYSISNLTLRIQGRADSIELDPVHKVVHIAGRDYSSVLIDTKVLPPDPNTTASRVAIAYAAKYGLKVNVTATKTKIGTYYEFDHVSLKCEKSAWDILTYLAKNEGFIVSVTGTTLNFGPRPTAKAVRTLTIDDSQRITTAPAPMVTFTRNLMMASGVIVRVRSWNHKHPKGFTKTAKMRMSHDPVLKHNPPMHGQPQIYTYSIPNLSAAEAQQRANDYLMAISMHEVTFTADDMPGDPTLDPFQPVQWNYNGTNYAQTYYLDSVIRSFRFHGGYTMSLRGKNHSVESVVEA